MLKVITVTNQPERAKPLLDSLTKFNWPYALLQVEWRGFGGKLIATYEYLKANPEVTEFIFCDAHDVVCLAGEAAFREKLTGQKDMMICSAERGLWPPALIPFRSLYSSFEHGFNYINSGLYYSPVSIFMALFENFTPFYEIDDQMWLNLCWLFSHKSMFKPSIGINYGQSIFNSHSFIREGEYTYENGRVYINGASPIFIHGNGGGLPQQVYDLLK